MSDAPSVVSPAPDASLIRGFIARVEWRFAKTMAWCPHYYNFLIWNPPENAGFLELSRAIKEHGYTEWWPEDVEDFSYANPCTRAVLQD